MKFEGIIGLLWSYNLLYDLSGYLHGVIRADDDIVSLHELNQLLRLLQDGTIVGGKKRKFINTIRLTFDGET